MDPVVKVVNGAVASTVRELVVKLSPVKVNTAWLACRVFVKPSVITLKEPAARVQLTAVNTGAVLAIVIVTGESPVATTAAPPLVNCGVIVITPASVPAFKVKFTVGLVFAGAVNVSVLLPFEN